MKILNAVSERPDLNIVTRFLIEKSKGAQSRVTQAIQDNLRNTQDTKGFIRIDICSVPPSGDHSILSVINMPRCQ